MPTVTPTPRTATQTPIPSDLQAESREEAATEPAAEATSTAMATPAEPNPTAALAGGVLAFTSARDGNFEVYLVNADSVEQDPHDPQRLTNQPGEDYWTTWSPDGTQIAFASERDGNYEIYVMNVDGSNQRRLTDDSADDLEPDWSPDGTQIAFMYYSAGHTEIYVMDVDGSNRQQLTDSGGGNYLPDWSPDGAQIVFVSERDGNPEIYVMNADGSDPRRLTDNGGDDRYPAWSPDGMRISFFSVREGGRGLYVMDANGGNLQRLTHNDATVWVSDWSPDGAMIAFTSDRDGNREIYVMDADGSNLQRLTNNHVLDGIPAWRPVPTVVSPPAPSTLGDIWTRPADRMEMVYVPAGEFQMGSDEHNADADDNEFPQHAVILDGFWIDRTEVTNSQYTACVDDGACKISRYANDSIFNGKGYPVVGLPWQDAADYCAWVGGRLPTEAEWEYAARGEQGNRYPWGDTFDTARLNYCDANCDEGPWADKVNDDGYAQSAPVGTYPDGASWCGALDLAGNVWEWVADWYGDYSAAAQTNPTGPETGSARVLRGGCWANDARGVRGAYRISIAATIRHSNVGFRCIGPVGE